MVSFDKGPCAGIRLTPVREHFNSRGVAHKGRMSPGRMGSLSRGNGPEHPVHPHHNPSQIHVRFL